MRFSQSMVQQFCVASLGFGRLPFSFHAFSVPGLASSQGDRANIWFAAYPAIAGPDLIPVPSWPCLEICDLRLQASSTWVVELCRAVIVADSCALAVPCTSVTILWHTEATTSPAALPCDDGYRSVSPFTESEVLPLRRQIPLALSLPLLPSPFLDGGAVDAMLQPSQRRKACNLFVDFAFCNDRPISDSRSAQTKQHRWQRTLDCPCGTPHTARASDTSCPCLPAANSFSFAFSFPGDTLLRSFLLLQLLSFLRLLGIGARQVKPTRGRKSCAGTGHLRSPSLLKGAPLAIVLCLCCPTAQAVVQPGTLQWQRLQCADAHAHLPLPNLWAPFTVEFVGPLRRGQDEFAQFHDEVRLDAQGQIPLPVPDVEDRGHNFRFVSEVLFFQRSSCFSFHVAANTPDLDSLVDTVHEQIDVAATADKLIIVSPQPTTNRPVFLAVHIRSDVTPDVPVCLQVQRRGARAAFWLAYVGEHCSYAEVRDLAGDLFHPGMILRVGSDDAPLFLDDSFRATAGMLVRLNLPGRAPRRPRMLSELLESPADTFADVEEEGIPEHYAIEGSRCILQRFTCPTVVTLNAHTPAGELLRHIAARTPVPSDTCAVVRPLARISDVCINGVGAESVLGIRPSDLAGRAGVFIDARDIAVSLKFIVVPVKFWIVSEFARAIGIECLAPLKIVTTRGGTATSAQGRFATVDADLIIITCLLYPVSDDVEAAVGEVITITGEEGAVTTEPRAAEVAAAALPSTGSVGACPALPTASRTNADYPIGVLHLPMSGPDEPAGGSQSRRAVWARPADLYVGGSVPSPASGTPSSLCRIAGAQLCVGPVCGGRVATDSVHSLPGPDAPQVKSGQWTTATSAVTSAACRSTMPKIQIDPSTLPPPVSGTPSTLSGNCRGSLRVLTLSSHSSMTMTAPLQMMTSRPMPRARVMAARPKNLSGGSYVPCFPCSPGCGTIPSLLPGTKESNMCLKERTSFCCLRMAR